MGEVGGGLAAVAGDEVLGLPRRPGETIIVVVCAARAARAFGGRRPVTVERASEILACGRVGGALLAAPICQVVVVFGVSVRVPLGLKSAGTAIVAGRIAVRGAPSRQPFLGRLH